MGPLKNSDDRHQVCRKIGIRSHIAADGKRFGQQINADEVFGTHTPGAMPWLPTGHPRMRPSPAEICNPEFCP